MKIMKKTISKPGHMLTYQQELDAANTLTTLLVRGRSLTSSSPPPPRIPDANTAAVELLVRHDAVVPPDSSHLATPGLLLPSSPQPLSASLPLPSHILGVPAAQNQNNALHSVSTNHPSSVLDQPQVRRTTKSIKVKKNFPQKLLEILETAEHFDILKWLPGGRAFAIMDKKRFTSEILPAYLKQAQFTSFTRKLFRWKFITVPYGPFMGVYYHELFRRDRPDLCKLMSCSSNTNVSTSLATIPQPPSQEDEAEVQTNEFSISTSSPSSRSKTLVLLDDMSILREHTLQIAEQANRVIMIKEQLMNVYLNTRAHLYEQQHKTIARQNNGKESGRTSAAAVISFPQARSSTRQRPLLPNTRNQGWSRSHSQQAEEHHNKHQSHFLFYGEKSTSDNNSCRNSSRILQDAYRVQKSAISMEYNARMSNLAKLRQTGIL
jgi:hypothetical protein